MRALLFPTQRLSTAHRACCFQTLPRFLALSHLDHTYFQPFPPPASAPRLGEKGEEGKKIERKEKEKKKRHTERQLPQLLAGILIKTKLVSFSEQT